MLTPLRHIILPPKPKFGPGRGFIDPASATTYNLPPQYLGPGHPKKMNVFAIVTETNVAVTGVVVNKNITAALAVTSGSNSRSAELWYADTKNLSFAEIDVTFSGGAANAFIFTWFGFPDSIVPVDAVGANNSAGSLTLTDLAKTQGGFGCLVASTNVTGSTIAFTQNGQEAINHDYPAATLESIKTVGAGSFLVKETIGSNDFVATFGSSIGCGFAGATWR